MKRTVATVVLATALLFAGCAPLTYQQRADYDLWKAQGKVIQEKSETAAFFLGLLPGGGSFYTRQYGIGVVDTLLWPLSVLWDPSIGVGGAKKINFEATKYAKDAGRLP